MRLRTARNTAIIVAGALAASGIGITAAYADPPGCTVSIAFSHPSGLLTSHASASCGSSETRTLVAEIKWNKSLAPDPLVASNSQRKTAKTFSVTTSACDNGNTRGYYARGYFTVNTTFHDTSPVSVTSCT